MSASHRRPALLAALALAGAGGALSVTAAPAAAAPTLIANKACYVNRSTTAGTAMTLAGAGFTPGQSLQLSGGTAFKTVRVGPQGTFTATTPAPATSHQGVTRTTITAADRATGAAVARVVVRSTLLAVSASHTSVRNVRKDKVTYTFSGFTPGKRIFGFYMRRSRVVATMRFGKAGGPCGTLHQRALLYPGGRPRANSYKVAFESTSHYSKKAAPQVTATLRLLPF